MIKGAVLFAIGALALAMLAPSYFQSPAEPPAAPGPAAFSPQTNRRPAPQTARPPDFAKRRFRPTRAANLPPMPLSTARLSGCWSTPARASWRCPPRPLRGSASFPVRGRNGPSAPPTANSKASPVTLDAVSFGGLYLRDVQALILAPEAGNVNLLGASFLKRLVSVEQRDGIMILRQ